MTAPKLRGDSLGDRMKGYERACRTTLPQRMPVIIRVDGKAFHSYTRGCKKPFDGILMADMDDAAEFLCEEIQGAVFAFVQSDEISVLVHNYRTLFTEAWFDNQAQKMVSVAASLATARFNAAQSRQQGASGQLAHFDARVFVLPEAEVCNYFIWRQQDATRNSIQMAARAVFSHKRCEEKNCNELQEMLFTEKGINWNDYSPGEKRGRGVVREAYEREGVVRHRWNVVDVPIFTQDRNFIERHLATEPA